ncbi:MAG: response regulator transcription factor, partial [Acidimicrobiia bacterium]|nr:response regulator transcription factor [Acidimicrobiia bacterium]
MNAYKPIRILLVDDHAMVRRGFRLILGEHPTEFDVVGEAGSGQTALELIPNLKPDLVLLDVAMPNMNGVETTQAIVQNWPRVKVVIVSMHKDSSYVRESLRTGAKGYVLKESVDAELLQAVRTVAGGDGYIAPGVSNIVLSDYQRFVGSPLDSLTSREMDVFRLLAQGKLAKEIAA